MEFFSFFSLKRITNLLKIITAGLIFHLAFIFFLWEKRMREIPQLPKEECLECTKDAPSEETQNLSTLKSPTFYKQNLKKRNIFQLPLLQEELTVSPILAEVGKTLKVVGISLSNAPEVMLKDLNANKTYFLKQGERFEQIMIKEILNDRVILNIKGEEVELILK